MKFLLYRSVATPTFRDESLDALVAQAQAFNTSRGISGLLVYTDRRFFQWIEGEDGDVDLLFSRIRTDGRHQYIDVLMMRPAIQRHFGSWGMMSHLVEPEQTSTFLHLGNNELIQRFIQYGRGYVKER